MSTSVSARAETFHLDNGNSSGVTSVPRRYETLGVALKAPVKDGEDASNSKCSYCGQRGEPAPGLDFQY